jgi:hypothetical protein
MASNKHRKSPTEIKQALNPMSHILRFGRPQAFAPTKAFTGDLPKLPPSSARFSREKPLSWALAG